MVSSEHPPKHELNRLLRKLYNPIGFTKFYNFVLCMSTLFQKLKSLIAYRVHILWSFTRLLPRKIGIHEL